MLENIAAMPTSPQPHIVGSQDEPLPAAIAAEGALVIRRLHAQGAQIYECQADSAGKLQWVLREPIAALFDENGKTIGRHYLGPRWELDDGSLLVGKAVSRAPAADPNDIPLVKLQATAERNEGCLAKVTLIQRLATHGGQPTQACTKPGDFLSSAYSADYVFLVQP